MKVKRIPAQRPSPRSLPPGEGEGEGLLVTSWRRNVSTNQKPSPVRAVYQSKYLAFRTSPDSSALSDSGTTSMSRTRRHQKLKQELCVFHRDVSPGLSQQVKPRWQHSTIICNQKDNYQARERHTTNTYRRPAFCRFRISLLATQFQLGLVTQCIAVRAHAQLDCFIEHTSLGTSNEPPHNTTRMRSRLLHMSVSRRKALHEILSTVTALVVLLSR